MVWCFLELKGGLTTTVAISLEQRSIHIKVLLRLASHLLQVERDAVSEVLPISLKKGTQHMRCKQPISSHIALHTGCTLSVSKRASNIVVFNGELQKQERRNIRELMSVLAGNYLGNYT